MPVKNIQLQSTVSEKAILYACFLCCLSRGKFETYKSRTCRSIFVF